MYFCKNIFEEAKL